MYTYFTPLYIEKNGNYFETGFQNMSLIGKPWPSTSETTALADPNSISLFSIDRIATKINGDGFFVKPRYELDADNDVQHKLKHTLSYIFSHAGCTVESYDSSNFLDTNTGLEENLAGTMTDSDVFENDSGVSNSILEAITGEGEKVVQSDIYANANALLMALSMPMLLGKSKIVKGSFETGKMSQLSTQDFKKAYDIVDPKNAVNTSMTNSEKNAFLADLPHQVKAFIISAIGGAPGVTNVDGIKSNSFKDIAAFSQISNNIKKVEVLIGYGLASNQTLSPSKYNARIMLQKENWAPLTKKIIDESTSSIDRTFLCRIVPYSNSKFGIRDQNDSIELPVSNRYFFLKARAGKTTMANIFAANTEKEYSEQMIEGSAVDNHDHFYTLDAAGNGFTNYIVNPTDPNAASHCCNHRHEVINGVVQPAIDYTNPVYGNVNTNFGSLEQYHTHKLAAHHQNLDLSSGINELLTTLISLAEATKEPDDGDQDPDPMIEGFGGEAHGPGSGKWQ